MNKHKDKNLSEFSKCYRILKTLQYRGTSTQNGLTCLLQITQRTKLLQSAKYTKRFQQAALESDKKLTNIRNV